MDDIKDMLHAVLNGQQSLRKELLCEIAKLRKELTNETGSLRKEMKDGFKAVNDRLDKQGAQLAYLEEGAPTRKEFDKLTHRVKKTEQQLKN